MKTIDKKIFVTKSYLPPYKTFESHLRQIWKRRVLTNNGPLVQQLEADLKAYLGVRHVFFVANGTIAMQIALKALDITKEVITTPFTYVATTNAIMWEGCTPVYVDINEADFNIDPKKIEAAITKRTQAILAVHVFGYPCNIAAIEAIAKKHNLKVIYDAAHAFGTKIESTSVLNFGDISTLSFHATKLFHTGEGGAVITNDDDLAERIRQCRSFGQVDETFVSPGVNAKNSEFHAAIGLCVLPKVKCLMRNRKKIVDLYDTLLAKSDVQRPITTSETIYNYSYYPAVFKSEEQMLTVMQKLHTKNIFPRRYFYPSLNTLNYVHQAHCPISESIASRIICLPLYHDLALDDVKLIARTINQTLAVIKRKQAFKHAKKEKVPMPFMLANKIYRRLIQP